MLVFEAEIVYRIVDMANAAMDLLEGTSRTPNRRRSPLSERLIVTTVWLFALARVVVEVIGQTEIVSFGFYTFHIVDIPIALSVGTAALCLLRNGLAQRFLIVPAILIALLLGYNLILGITTSSAPALLWARNCVSIGTLLLIGVSAGRDIPVGAIRRALLFTAALLALLVVLRLATTPNLFMINGWSAAETNDGGRPLSAQGTLMIVLPTLWLWSDVLRAPGWRFDLRMFSAVALPVLVLATRQGTASISLLVGLAVVFLLEPGRNRLPRVFTTVGIGILVGIFAFMIVPMLADQLEFGQRQKNFGWRQAIWDAINLLWPQLPWHTQAFGIAGGQMPALDIHMDHGYVEWQGAVHSMYYQMLVVSGFIGLASYCLLLGGLSIICLGRVLRSKFPAYPLAFCTVTVIFGYSYDVRAEQLVGVLMAIWLTNTRFTGRAPSRPIETHDRALARERDLDDRLRLI
jgi:O-antigen ligase